MLRKFFLNGKLPPGFKRSLILHQLMLSHCLATCKSLSGQQFKHTYYGRYIYWLDTSFLTNSPTTMPIIPLPDVYEQPQTTTPISPVRLDHWQVLQELYPEQVCPELPRTEEDLN